MGFNPKYLIESQQLSIRVFSKNMGSLGDPFTGGKKPGGSFYRHNNNSYGRTPPPTSGQQHYTDIFAEMDKWSNDQVHTPNYWVIALWFPDGWPSLQVLQVKFFSWFFSNPHYAIRHLLHRQQKNLTLESYWISKLHQHSLDRNYHATISTYSISPPKYDVNFIPWIEIARKTFYVWIKMLSTPNES